MHSLTLLLALRLVAMAAADRNRPNNALNSASCESGQRVHRRVWGASVYT